MSQATGLSHWRSEGPGMFLHLLPLVIDGGGKGGIRPLVHLPAHTATGNFQAVRIQPQWLLQW